ncbi:MAG: hypothetical protein NT133_25475 [Alphaproteobacteria bacterium]|nr:hypothetical protein [Alphaproteobacteria bacterium]
MALQIRINGTTTSTVVVDSSTEDPTLPVFIGRNGAALGGLKTDGSHHWNILNEGSIFGGYAVAFYGASTLTNGSATNSAAAITGTTDGVGSAPGGTVTNFGTIIALGQDGVAMGSIAVVRNIGTAAVITGYTHGVLGGGAAQLHLTNSGTIGATGSHSVGVFARADSVSADILNSGKISGSANGILLNVIGTVTNSGIITSADLAIYTTESSRLVNTGVISGGNRGFWSNFAPDVTVINSGTISGPGWRGIEIAHNVTGLVFNSGLISGNLNGVTLDAGSIINSGTIAGGTTFLGNSIANSGTMTGSGNYALVMLAAARVSNIGAGSYIHSPREGIRVDVGTGFILTNEGTISGGGLAGLALRTTDASIDNTGLISGHQYGITQYNSNTITNTGTIAGGFVGIQSRGGDTITNMAGGSIHGAHGGIVSGSGSLAVANDGMIDTDAPDPVFAAISAETLNLLNRQNGTIAPSGVAIAAGTATISNHGTILGAIEISGGGDSRLVNVAGGYIGGIPSGDVAVRSSGSGTFRLINAGTISGGDGADVVQFSNTGSTTLVEHAGAHIIGVGETRISASGHDDTLRLANDGVVGVLDSMTITGFETVSLNRGAHWTAGDEIFVGTHNLNVSRGGTLAASGTWQMDDLHGIIGVVDILPTGRLQVGADAPLGGMSVGVGEAITLRGTLTTASALVVDGQVTVPDGAALTINGDLAGSGIVQIGTNSVLDLNGVSTAAQLNFIGTGATLTLTSPTRFFSAIGGLAAGDTVDLQGIRFGNGPIIASQLPGGTTDVHLEYDGGSFELTFLGSGGAYTPLGFGDDGHGGMLIYFSG